MDSAAQQQTDNTLPPPGLTTAFKTWVDASGYPVLNVVRDYENKTASITQVRLNSLQGRKIGATRL